MKNKKNILFITWDGDQTTYAESLFMPIYDLIQKKDDSIKFHYMEFTWAQNIFPQKSAAKKYNIPYTKVTIHRKPTQASGGFYTLLMGVKKIQAYVKKHDINVLMPRSTFPAYMVLQSKLDLPIVFDADGLPIEERIEFANLRRDCLMHKFLFNIEHKIVNKANIVLTRSKKAISYHLKNHQVQHREKFFVVSNGRDAARFTINLSQRERIRKQLGIPSSTYVFIYLGSFGGKYGFDEVFQIFRAYSKVKKDVRFLLLTGSPDKAKAKIPNELSSYFNVMNVSFKDVPAYLNAADIAFSIIKPTLSMQAVVPIKLGEYLLTGLPTIVSKETGDVSELIEDKMGVFMFDYVHYNKSLNSSLSFIESVKKLSRKDIRLIGLDKFSLEEALNSYLSAFSNLL